jgi:hypothetical protein
VGATEWIERVPGERRLLWQPRFFDRSLRTVNEYHAKAEYIRLNPAKAGLARRPEEVPQSNPKERDNPALQAGRFWHQSKRLRAGSSSPHHHPFGFRPFPPFLDADSCERHQCNCCYHNPYV